MIDRFERFLADPEAHEFYITGPAGTGKTTSLSDLLEYCHDRQISALAAAYTHKAVSVLQSKLPRRAKVCTLHSYLKKHPTVNASALHEKYVDGNAQVDVPDHVDMLFVDEFSMIGERDYMSIIDLQYDGEGNVLTKVVYIGDLNQLPPVKDQQTISPSEPYWVKLTKIHRQADDNPLIDTLMALHSYINGNGRAVKLQEHRSFIRNVDLVEGYKACTARKILLAYTNAQVEILNAEVQGYEQPRVDDLVYSPTVRRYYRLLDAPEALDCVISIGGEVVLMDSKYKTLETLREMEGIRYMVLADEDGNEEPRAVVFGHDTFLRASQAFARRAVHTNKVIEAKHKVDPKEWSSRNWKTDLARDRAEAWRRYLAFKKNVLCVDFPHAMTVHKSQGSTYDYVFLDVRDLGRCADSDYQMYLKLMYVAISRASQAVYTN